MRRAVGSGIAAHALPGPAPNLPPRSMVAASSIARRSWTLIITIVFTALAVAWLAGWRLQNVQSASMAPLIPKGSLAVVAPMNPRDIEAGDVISFLDPADRRARILHRVEAVLDRGAEGRYFRTQGDANTTPDALVVPAHLVEGTLRWHSPRLGAIAWALRPPVGLVTLIALSTAASFLGKGPGLRREKTASRSESHLTPGRAEAFVVPQVTADQVREACASSWREYFARSPRLNARPIASVVAASWRDYYVVATASNREIDVRDRTIVLDAAEDARTSTELKRT